MIFPRRPADVALAVVVEVARRPLRLEIPLPSVADQRAIARRRHGQPIREMAAIAGAAGDLPGRVDEAESLDRRVGGLVDVVGRSLERVELNVLRELLTVARRPCVIGHQHDEARGGGGGAEEMRIPTEAKGVGPHVGGAAVDQDEQRIRTRRIESGRHGIEAVNVLAATRSEPELAERLPVDPRHALAIEMGERRPPAGRGIDAHNFGGTDRALPRGSDL